MFKLLDIGAAYGFPVGNLFPNAALLRAYKPREYEAMVPAADLVMFGGGSDIHPSIYGCEDVGSGVGIGPSNRDKFEIDIFKLAKELGKPMIGICRGAQFLCAMNGGKLVQDVTGHGATHAVTASDGDVFLITSTHHQMMYPWDVEHELLSWSNNRSKEYLHDIPDYIQHNCDPEAVYFPEGRCLAVQGHPEWMAPTSAAVIKLQDWANHFFNLKG